MTGSDTLEHVEAPEALAAPGPTTHRASPLHNPDHLPAWTMIWNPGPHFCAPDMPTWRPAPLHCHPALHPLLSPLRPTGPLSQKPSTSHPSTPSSDLPRNRALVPFSPHAVHSTNQASSPSARHRHPGCQNRSLRSPADRQPDPARALPCLPPLLCLPRPTRRFQCRPPSSRTLSVAGPQPSRSPGTGPPVFLQVQAIWSQPPSMASRSTRPTHLDTPSRDPSSVSHLRLTGFGSSSPNRPGLHLISLSLLLSQTPPHQVFWCGAQRSALLGTRHPYPTSLPTAQCEAAGQAPK